MAMKDWKKIGKDEWKSKRQVHLVIKYFDETVSNMHYKIVTGSKVFGFKTKSQALKFAKAYMKKH